VGVVSRICGIINIVWIGARLELKNNCLNTLVYRSLADGMIVNAWQIRETVTSDGLISERNIKVLYRGINSTMLDRYRISPPQKCGTMMVITTTGRFDRNKSHDLLLRGFARFLILRPGIEERLQILGEGNERTRLEQLIGKLGIGEQVQLRGFISDPYPVWHKAMYSP